MPDDRLARALDACVAAMRAGATLDECLARFPALRDDLEPLLRAALRVQRHARTAVQTTNRAAARARLLAQINQRPVRQETSGGWLRLVPFPIAIAGALALALFLGLGTLHAPPTSEAATILTILQGEVVVEGGSGSVAATSGMTLSPGDRVVTGPGARAVLTFFDGSTVTLASETNVAIETLSEEDGQLQVLLVQQQGQTWTHIPSRLAPALIEIDTPTARVQTRDAQFLTTVEGTGRTWVDTRAGAVELTSGKTKAALKRGYKVAVDSPGVVSTPAANTLPEQALTLRVVGEVFAVLTDPNESSAGTLANGVPVNQIPAAEAEEAEGSFVFHLPEPQDGIYQLGFHARDAGSLVVSASLSTRVEHEITKLEVRSGEYWLLTFTIADGVIEVGELVQLDEASFPPNVTVPPLAERRADLLGDDETPTPEASTTRVVESPTATTTPSATPTATVTPSPTPNSATPTPTATPTVVATP